MALKSKITKEEHAKLSKELKAEYTADGEGFVLNLEETDDDEDDGDDESVGELRRALDRERADAKKLRLDLKKVTERLAALENGRDNKDKDVEKLEGEWKERFETQKAEDAERLKAANDRIAKTMIDSAANSLASEVSTKPKWLSRDIKDRLTVVFDEETGEAELVIKNTKGKNSDMSLSDLKKEILQNKEYADILIGSKASGSGTTQKASDKKPGGTVVSDDKPVDLSKLSGKDLAAAIREKRERSEA